MRHPGNTRLFQEYELGQPGMDPRLRGDDVSSAQALTGADKLVSTSRTQ
jgi:hypothetical protein